MFNSISLISLVQFTPRCHTVFVFGLYRYALALAVLVSHLCGIGILGWLAVHGFFILSGYLMTLILHRDYGYDKAGLTRFLTNRALRLFPLYWCAIILAGVLFLLLGTYRSPAFYVQMSVPDTVGGWLENLTLIYPRWFPTETPAMLSPPSWTLTIEWLFYIFMALGVSRTPRLTYIWLGLATLYFAGTHLAGLGLEWRYSALAAGALPFALGASLYHILPIIRRYETRLQRPGFFIWLVGLLVLNAGFCILALVEELTPLLNVTFYSNMILSLGLIMCLALRHQPRGRNRLERADKALGDLSYPTYILHLPVAFGLSVLILGQGERVYDATSILLVLMTIVACATLGWVLNRLIDTPVQRLRDYLRGTP